MSAASGPPGPALTGPAAVAALLSIAPASPAELAAAEGVATTAALVASDAAPAVRVVGVLADTWGADRIEAAGGCFTRGVALPCEPDALEPSRELDPEPRSAESPDLVVEPPVPLPPEFVEPPVPLPPEFEEPPVPLPLPEPDELEPPDPWFCWIHQSAVPGPAGVSPWVSS